MLGNYTGASLQYVCNLVGGMTPSSIVTYVTDVDGYTISQSYNEVYKNIYTQFNISTHELISGQNPLTIVAYKVNGTWLSSDGTSGDTDLGGPLRIFVVINNGTSRLMINDGMGTFGMVMCKCVTHIVISNAGRLRLAPLTVQVQQKVPLM
jgi:hypothetical protein